MNIEELKDNIDGELSPALVATELGFFTSDALKCESISLYEALYLKELEYALLLQASEKPAWNYKIGISLLLSLELLYSLALYFDEKELAKALKSKISIALENSSEIRHHYSKAVAEDILSGNIESALLRLGTSREGAKPFDDGPYNEEVFPWDLIAPEKEVLSKRFGSMKSISPAIKDLVAEVWVSHG